MKTSRIAGELGRVAFIGTYLPRQCGLATFTYDLCEAFAARYPQTDCVAVAMNDEDHRYDYPARVAFEIRENDRQAYTGAAAWLRTLTCCPCRRLVNT